MKSEVHCSGSTLPALSELVNDKHSRLNPTLVKSRVAPVSAGNMVDFVRMARAAGEKICVAGGRHAMGGQQFLDRGILVDTSNLDKVLHFDGEQGLIEVQAGMRWPQLVDYLRGTATTGGGWAIRQKQTGCDALSIGGALSANIHGRGLRQAPFVSDVEEFKLVTASGELINCSRRENAELFSLAAGGYGLFGLIASATLRLAPRRRLRRRVEMVGADCAVATLEERAAAGASHGDFQFNIDDQADDFLQSGILSTYAPVDPDDGAGGDTAVQSPRKELSEEDWRELIYLAHCDKKKAYDKYVRHYQNTDGQTYWSDVFQLSTYVENYHAAIDHGHGGRHAGSELISELYVPRSMLAVFLRDAAALLRAQGSSVIYGTVRLIEKDTETFMPWAKESWACIVLNLHVEHSEQGLAAAKKSFCGLIDAAIALGGSYYLTYHRFAQRRQLLTCYPQLEAFLRLKQVYDPQDLYMSDWYLYLLNELRS